MQSATRLTNLRVWRDDRLNELWRVAYNEGEGEMLVSFPDTQALGDFLVERLGLCLLDEHEGRFPDSANCLSGESASAETYTLA